MFFLPVFAAQSYIDIKMRKIKVAQVITRMDWGGSPDLVRIFCQGLKRQGFEVTLIAGRSLNPSSKTKDFLEGFRDSTVLMPELKRNISPLWDAVALFKLYSIFRRKRFDVVHANTSKAGFLARIAAHCAGVSCIVYMPHGHVFYGYFGPVMSRILVFLERIAAKVTDRIIVLTKLEKRDFLNLGVACPDAIHIIPSGLEVSEFFVIGNTAKEELRQKHGLDSEKKIIGMVSRLESVKGPQFFIEAVRTVLKSRDDVIFLIIGEGDMSSQLRSLVKDRGLQDKVTFLGWREDVLELIALMDILVQPSLNEAVGRVLLEAQMLGVPVVATDVGGIPEVVKNNLTGIVIPPKDPDALGEAVCKLLESDTMRLSMSDEAKKWVRAEFSSEEMIRKLINVYQEVLTAES